MSDEVTRDFSAGRSFEERVFARFDAMDGRFNAVDERFDAIGERFNAVDARFNAVDARFDGVDARFDGVDARLEGLDVRVQALEAKALDTKPIWERALAEILEVRKGVEDLNRKVDVLTLDVMQMRADHRRAEKRLDGLESRVQ